MKVRFSWKTKKRDTIRRISERFKVRGITINYESTIDVQEDELNLLKECEERGYIEIRKVERKNEEP